MKLATEDAMIDGIISIALGLLACYYGFRSLPVSGDAAVREMAALA
jgi:hypothetical protein